MKLTIENEPKFYRLSFTIEPVSLKGTPVHDQVLIQFSLRGLLPYPNTRIFAQEGSVKAEWTSSDKPDLDTSSQLAEAIQEKASEAISRYLEWLTFKDINDILNAS